LCSNFNFFIVGPNRAILDGLELVKKREIAEYNLLLAMPFLDHLVTIEIASRCGQYRVGCKVLDQFSPVFKIA
jgi:hypothetical protein